MFKEALSRLNPFSKEGRGVDQSDQYKLQGEPAPEMQSLLAVIDQAIDAQDFAQFDLQSFNVAEAVDQLGLTTEDIARLQAEAADVAHLFNLTKIDTRSPELKKAIKELARRQPAVERRQLKLALASTILVPLLVSSLTAAVYSDASAAGESAAPIGSVLASTELSGGDTEPVATFTVTIAADSLNVRKAPKNGEVVGSMKKGETVTLTEGGEALVDGVKMIISATFTKDIEEANEVWVKISPTEWIALRSGKDLTDVVKDEPAPAVAAAEVISDTTKLEVEKGGAEFSVTDLGLIKDSLINSKVFAEYKNFDPKKLIVTGTTIDDLTVKVGTQVWKITFADGTPQIVDSKGAVLAVYKGTTIVNGQELDMWGKPEVVEAGIISWAEVKAQITASEVAFMEQGLPERTVPISAGSTESTVEVNKAWFEGADFRVVTSSNGGHEVSVYDPETGLKVLTWETGHGYRLTMMHFGSFSASIDMSMYTDPLQQNDGSVLGTEIQKRLIRGTIHPIQNYGRLLPMTPENYQKIPAELRGQYEQAASVAWMQNLGAQIDSMGAQPYDGQTVVQTAIDRFMQKWNSLAGPDQQITKVELVTSGVPENGAYYDNGIINAMPSNRFYINEGKAVFTFTENSTDPGSKAALIGFSTAGAFGHLLNDALYKQFGGEKTGINYNEKEHVYISAPGEAIQGYAITNDRIMTAFIGMTADGKITD